MHESCSCNVQAKATRGFLFIYFLFLRQRVVSSYLLLIIITFYCCCVVFWSLVRLVFIKMCFINQLD